MTPAVLQPITLRTLEIRNRIWVPPMCQYAVERQDGVPTDWHLMHLGSFARGGAGAIIVEATGVVPEGRISPQDTGLYNDEQQEAFRRITEFVHSLGAAIGIQLAHAGRKASTYRPWGETRAGSVPIDEGGWIAVAPTVEAFPGLAEPLALDEAGIRGVVAGFAAAARRAVDAGFDFVEIHAAHGYLVHEFLSPLSNTRTDGFGGSLEHRARILLEIVDAVRAEVGEDVPVLVRVSATDWTDGGLTLDDTTTVVGWLAEHGVDMVDVSSGGNVASATIPVGPGYQVPLAAGIRAATGIPVGAVGVIDDSQQAEQIVASGQADVVLVGREFLRDANFVFRVADELGVDVPYRPSPYLRAYR